MRTFALSVGLLALALTGRAAAQDLSKFTDGPVITGFGKVAQIQSDLPIPQDMVFKVILAGSAAAKPGDTNRTLIDAARFLNMHAAAGLPEKNIHIAIIIHGPASDDLMNDANYGAHHDGKSNANAALIGLLLKHGAQIYLCGQTAAASGIAKTDLLPGVKLSLSAMTAMAVLQQQGFVPVQ